MKLPQNGPSNARRFFLLLLIIIAAAVADYNLFLRKANRIELYDDLHSRINEMRVSITQIEYLLDMFVVASRFEGTTVNMIKGDVVKVERNIGDTLGDPDFASLMENDSQLSDGVNALHVDWLTIKNEISRLDAALSRDEIILVHNAVDMNTVLIIEKADRLLGLIARNRMGVFESAKAQALVSMAVFILAVIASALLYRFRLLSPIERAADVAREMAHGRRGARFAGRSSGAVGALERELDSMLDSFDDELRAAVEEKTRTERVSEARASQFEGLSALLEEFGRSISQDDIFDATARACVREGGASAAAVYIEEEGVMKRLASAGAEDVFAAAALSPGRSRETVIIDDLKGEDGAVHSSLVSAREYHALVGVPISAAEGAHGWIYAAFREQGCDLAGEALFFGAVASGISFSAARFELFQREYASRRFLERVVNQMPFGIAVFDVEGACVLLNSALKKILGAGQLFDFAAEFRVFEHDSPMTRGMAASIRKSYEGYVTESVLDYDPATLGKYGFRGPPRRLKTRGYPLYGAGGEISNTVIIYEDLSGLEDVRANAGNGS